MQKSLTRVGLGVLVLLGIPTVLTLLNPTSHVRGGAGGGWDWNPWGLLFFVPFFFCVGLAIDFAARKIKSSIYRTLVIGLILTPILLAWILVATSE